MLKKSVVFKENSGDKMELYIKEDGQLIIEMDLEFHDFSENLQNESKYIVFNKSGVGELIKTLVEFEKEMTE